MCELLRDVHTYNVHLRDGRFFFTCVVKELGYVSPAWRCKNFHLRDERGQSTCVVLICCFLCDDNMYIYA